MAGETVGLDLDERRAAARTCAGDRLARDVVDGDRVVAGDVDARHAVARRAGVVADDRRRFALGDRNPPGVVLDHEQDGQLPDRREVQRLVERALVRGAFAQERHGDAGLALHLARQRRADRRPHTLRDNARAGKIDRGVEDVHVAASAAAEARRLAENLRRHFLQVDAFGDRDMVRPMCRRDDVGRFEVGAHADRARLLSIRQMHFAGDRTARHVEGGRLAFEIRLLDRLLEIAADDHVSIHPELSLFVGLHRLLLMTPRSRGCRSAAIKNGAAGGILVHNRLRKKTCFATSHR